MDDKCFRPIVGSIYCLDPDGGEVITGLVCDHECEHECSCDHECVNPKFIPNQIRCSVKWAEGGHYCLTVSLHALRFRMTQQLIRSDEGEAGETVATSTDYPPMNIPVTLDTKLRVENFPLTDQINAVQLQLNVDLGDIELTGSIDTPDAQFVLDENLSVADQELTFTLGTQSDRMNPIEVNQQLTINTLRPGSSVAIIYGALA